MKEARTALRRGDADGALVVLWNAVEPARIAGDGRALMTIERYAAEIARGGDESQAREAERLLEVLRGAVAEGAAEAAATSRLEGELRAGGFEGMPPAGAGEDQEAPAGTGVRLGTILWLLILIAIVIVNVLGQTRE